ncbi:MAG: energy-coupling factor ABC transporter ATP-binding protein [Syntrophaceae bacterium]
MECRSVSFRYQEGTSALEDVNFLVGAGEFVALLASNGAGKTTLIKVMAGLLKPHTGVVLIDGVDIRDLPARQLYRSLGLMVQNPKDQLFGATVKEDIAFGPRNLGLTEEDVERRITSALESVAGLHLRDRAIHHLSFGEQKRVALAGVLAMEPSILLLDEATAGLDPAGETHMMHFLNRLNRERGITVVFATHSVDLLPLFADRVCVLERGRVAKCESAKAIFNEHEILERAGLRLPYISSLFHDMKRYDGIPINGLPLTVGQARRELLSLLPENLPFKNRTDSCP